MRAYIDRTLARLVQNQFDQSRPVTDAPCERETTEFVAAEMRAIGWDVRVTGGDPPSLIATLRGSVVLFRRAV